MALNWSDVFIWLLAVRSLRLWLPLNGSAALHQPQGNSPPSLQSNLPSLECHLTSVLLSTCTSWGPWATCRPRCWCTGWVTSAYNFYLYNRVSQCARASSSLILSRSPLPPPGGEHRHHRHLLLRLLSLLCILFLPPSALLLQGWSPPLPLPLPATVCRYTHDDYINKNKRNTRGST